MESLFNKKLITATVLALSLLIAVGCSSTDNKSDNNINGTKAKNETSAQSNIVTTSENSKPVSENSTNKVATNSNKSNSTAKIATNNSSNQDISDKIKNYILNGQGNKPDAAKMKWSPAFLNQVDINSLYKQYKSNGGNANDLESFAKYMTLNAPIPS